MGPAIALLEFDSIAVGIRAGDAMVKRAPLETLHAGSVQPGKYQVLAGGEVAEVEEARAAGRAAGGQAWVDEIFLPEVHPEVIQALTGGRRPAEGEALGIVETRTVAAVIGAADAGVKGALVRLLEVRLADGLGGKGYVLFSGEVSYVEAAVELGVASLPARDLLVELVVIPRLHDEMLDNLTAHPEFGRRVRSYQAES
ncbi:MAG: BMC domain-containing protein [Thermoanaerobaculia bacterium]